MPGLTETARRIARRLLDDLSTGALGSIGIGEIRAAIESERLRLSDTEAEFLERATTLQVVEQASRQEDES